MWKTEPRGASGERVHEKRGQSPTPGSERFADAALGAGFHSSARLFAGGISRARPSSLSAPVRLGELAVRFTDAGVNEGLEALVGRHRAQALHHALVHLGVAVRRNQGARTVLHH